VVFFEHDVSSTGLNCQVRQSKKTDFLALQALFVRAFGSALLPARWDWKYAHAPCWGTVVERDNRIIGFFGGMPRAFILRNQPVLGVQIGDTMVDPQQRGVSTRKGPFMLAAAAYFEQMETLHPGAQFAFGFPPERVLALGTRLGVYAPINSISILMWSSLPPKRQVFLKTRSINNWPIARRQQAISRLWAAMRASWPNVLLPVRDASWLQYRYLDHPETRYELLLLASRFTGLPQALVVVQTHTDHLELMDYVGPPQGVALAVRAARMHAASKGLSHVQGWFSQQLTQVFNVGEPTVHRSGIAVATNAWPEPRLPNVLNSPIWLMSGDTDYR
jgi:hypothetical protein